MAPVAYTPPQVAEQLQVKPITVLRWLRAGKLAGSNTPAGWRIRAADIERFLRSYQHRQRQPVPAPPSNLPDLMLAQQVALQTVWDNPDDEVWNDA
jgi:excisionase family DNA binding protein